MGGSRTSTANRTFKRSQSILVALQIGITFVILIFGGYLIKSVLGLKNTPTGFDSNHVFTAIYRTPPSNYSYEARCRFMTEFREKVADLPQVESAGIEFYPPLKWDGNSTIMHLTEDEWLSGMENPFNAILDSVDPFLFETLGIAIIRGRNFNQSDLQNRSKVVVIDRQVAEARFPHEDPIGKRILLHQSFQFGNDRQASEEHFFEIIGVVENVKRKSLMHPPETGTIYMHTYTVVPAWTSLLAKTKGNPYHVLEPVSDILASMDPLLSLGRVETMREIVQKNYKGQYYLMVLILVISGVALIISTVGLAGVISYIISTETREVGIRVSLGAIPTQIHKRFIKKWAVIFTYALSGGLVTSLFVIHKFSHLLYQMKIVDIGTITTVTLFVGLIVLLTVYLSSKSITKIDPVSALRSE